MAPARLGVCCQRVSGEPGEGQSGAEFDLSRLRRTVRRAQKVVVRSPPTEESNLSPPSFERRYGTGRGYDIRVCVCVCSMHVQRAGRHARVYGGDFQAEELR